MTDSKDYRQYLELHFSTIQETLGRIEAQTKKTNGRVSELENEVEILHEKLVLHPIECSKAKEISDLKDDLIEYKFLKRHPTWTIIIIAFFVISLIISSYGTFSTIANNIKTKDMQDEVHEIKETIK